jgi:alpha-tubulin suppressor-like RCC1 family protein
MTRLAAVSLWLLTLSSACSHDWKRDVDAEDGSTEDGSANDGGVEPSAADGEADAEPGAPADAANDSGIDAGPSTDPDAASSDGGLPGTDGAVPSGSVGFAGRELVASGRCLELTFTDNTSNQTAARGWKLSVMPSTAGGLFSDAACTQALSELSLPAGGSTGRVYLKAALADGSNAGELTLQALGSVSGTKRVSVRRAAASLAAGENFVCAALDDGALYCWGLALRAGANVQGDLSGVPVKVPLPAGERVATLAAGVSSACAITQSGKLMCWGENGSSQLGIGGNDTGTPQLVPTLNEKVTSVGVGEKHACAVKAGALYCWGQNDLGQLGLAATSTPTGVAAAPTAVPSYGSGVSSVACGFRHTCVTLQTGAVSCFGEFPVSVAPGGTQTRVSGFGPATCMLRDGAVQCLGQLSTNLKWGTSWGGVNTWSAGVTDLSVGSQHACAIKAGKVSCIGANADKSGLVFGAAGGSDAPDVAQPRTLPEDELPGVATALTTSHSHTWYSEGTSCAIADGLVYCWGSNITGELGDSPTLTAYTKAERVRALDAIKADDIFVPGSFWGSHACVIAAGNVHCWGNSSDGQLGERVSTFASSAVPVAIALPSAAKKLSLGPDHTCAIVADGVVCWGSNGTPQSANRSSPLAKSRVAIPGNPSAVDITSGESHTCAVVQESASARAVYCWGYHNGGRLGDGVDKEENAAPIKVPLTSGDISGIASAHWDTCALVAGGVTCWGPSYKTGTPTTFPLTPIAGISASSGRTLRDVSMSGAGACALWGSDVSCFSPWDAPLTRTGSATRLRAGTGQTCAVTSDGNAVCFGNNDSGQLGRGTLQDSDDAARVMGLVAPVKAIATGGEPHAFSCAIDAEGVKCWGSNIGRIIAPATLSRSKPGLVAPW